MMSRERTQSPESLDDPVRARIVAEARRHFLQHGFRGVTMSDLATELGMSKKTLYAHFLTKIELVEAVLRNKFDTIESDLASINTVGSTDFLAALQQMLACVQKHTDEVNPSFIRDVQRASPELFQVVEGRRRELIQRYFGALFIEGRKRGMVRKDVPIDVIVAVLLASTQAIVNPRALTELKLTPTTGFASILAIVLDGALTPKGRSAS